ncbi:MAG: hypothetical protein FJ211_02485 [Ignavibacteria bacterium]|nr:hypothetical protein [Ignavibacteria bacterium]
MARWIACKPQSVWTAFVEQSEVSLGMQHLPSGISIVIVPTSRQVEIVTRAWAEYNGTGEPPIIETMSMFIRRLGAHVMPHGPSILSENKVDLLIEHVIHESSLLKSVGFEAQKLVRWTQYGKSPRAIDELADQAGLHNRRGRMLAEIAAAWSNLRELYGGVGCDRGAYEVKVTSRVSKLLDNPLRTFSGDVIQQCVMIATHGVSDADKELLIALANIGWDIGVQFAPDPPDAFQRDNINISAIDAAWFASHHWISGSCTDQPCQYDVFRASLPSREEEVRRVVASIKKDITDGISMRDIAICMPGSSAYRLLIEDVARRSMLPLESEYEMPMSCSQPALIVKSVCELVRNRWAREDLERLLSHSLLQKEFAASGEVVGLARRERIHGGSNAIGWMQRFDELSQILHEEQQQVVDAKDEVPLQRKVNELNRAVATIHKISLHCPYSEHDVISAAAFVASFDGILSVIKSAEDYPSYAEATAEVEEQLEAYQILVDDHNLPKLSYRDHASRWWRLLASASTQVVRRSGKGVALAAPAELRCRRWKRIYVVGMVEGEYPRAQEHLTDREIMPGVLERMYLQGLTDILHACESSGQLVFTMPTHVDGSKTLPSSLLEYITAQAGEALPELLQTETNVKIYQTEVQDTSASIYRGQQNVVLGSMPTADLQLAYNDEVGRPVSPSRIDVFSQCPYKYFADKILRLEQNEILDAKLSPLERGTMLHDVAAEFFRRQQPAIDYASVSSGEDLLALSVKLDAHRVDDYWVLLQDVAHDVMQTASWAHTYAKLDQRVLFGTAERPGLLRQWLYLEIAYQATTQHYPTLMEIPIRVQIPMNTAKGIEDVAVSTRIDRVDIGQVDQRLTFIVNDYKASVSSGYTIGEIVSGSLSQMPIYLEATQIWMRNHNIDARPWAALYRSFGTALHSTDDPLNKVALRDPEFVIPEHAPGVKLTNWTGAHKEFAGQPLTEQNKFVLETIAGIVDSIHNGCFAVKPAKQACRRCDFGELCRVEQWGNG